jgi:hypothetical protein
MKLLSVFIFDPTVSTDEDTAEDNVLCYYPHDTHPDGQMNDAGFCTALMRLQERFAFKAGVLGDPVSITLASKRFTVINVEENIYVAVAVSRSAVSRIVSGPGIATAVTWSNDVPASADDVDDMVTDVVHRHAMVYYRIFRMMFGSMRSSFRKIWGPSSQKRATLVERMACRLKLNRLLQVGFIDKIVPVLRVALEQCCFEGAFASPGGMEIAHVDATVHYELSSIVGCISNGHPGAIRGIVVFAGAKMALSTLDVTDTATLFHLMRHYGENNSGTTAACPPSGSAAFTPTLLRDAALEEENPLDDFFSTDALMSSEYRRSSYLLSEQPRLAVPSHDEFPFVFIGEGDEPVGVLNYYVGAFRLLLLTREKYLRVAELCNGLHESIELTLQRHQGAKRATEAAIVEPPKVRELELAVLFHYTSAMISQVRSSIASRVPSPALGAALQGGPLDGSTLLTVDERVAVHYLDRVRCAMQHMVPNVHSAIIRVHPRTWCSWVRSGPRELSAVTFRSTFDEADKVLDGLARHVFFYSFKDF